MAKFQSHISSRITLSVFSTCFLITGLFSAFPARAGLILNHPNYTGLNQGLVGYWSFDGKDVAGIPTGATAGTVYDRSGQGNDGKYYNATGTQPVEGKLGQALKFDGQKAHVRLNNVSGVADLPASSISLWMKHSGSNAVDTNGNNQVFYVEESSSAAVDYALILQGDGGIAGYLNPSFCGSSPTTFNDNKWHHAVMVRQSKSSMTVYVDGIARCTDASAVGTITTNQAFIGIHDTDQGTAALNGQIDEVRIYNRALSADEIKRLYRIGATLHVNTQINNDSLKKAWLAGGALMAKTWQGFLSEQMRQRLTTAPAKGTTANITTQQAHCRSKANSARGSR